MLGAGPIAQFAHFDAVRKARNAELYAICDVAPDLLARMNAVHEPRTTFSDYDAMLADDAVDAVIIATSDAFHVPAALRALAAGKHVLVEKPVGTSVEEAAPKVIEALRSYDYFEPFFARLHAELRALQDTYGKWTGIEVFDPLKGLADKLLRSGGIDIQLRPDGTAYVNVPRNPETMPTLDEQVAFMASRAQTA